MKDSERSGVSRRREKVLALLSAAGDEPLSASALAAQCAVSRQIIVGDIAILRSVGHAIDATPRGYLLRIPEKEQNGCIRTFVCCHDADGMTEELNTIVDFGCTVCDVAVEHPVYGTLTGELRLSSRYDVAVFTRKNKESDALPLSILTEGVHAHTVRCPNEEIAEQVRAALAQKGYLKV